MTAALAVRSKSSIKSFKRIGPGNAIQSARGGVAAMFSLASYDNRHGVAMYSLRIANDSSELLICRIWTIGDDGLATLAYPKAFEVEPFSLRSVDVPVWPDVRNPFEHAVAEITGRSCAVSSRPPHRPFESRRDLIGQLLPRFAESWACWSLRLRHSDSPSLGS